MAGLCSHCGEGALQRVDHHFETLLVCKKCGASEESGTQFAHGSPTKYKIATARPFSKESSKATRRRITFSQQAEGFVEKRVTDQRRQCGTLLRIYLSKMDQVRRNTQGGAKRPK